MKVRYCGGHDSVVVCSPFDGSQVALVKRGEEAEIPDDIAERLGGDWKPVHRKPTTPAAKPEKE